MTEVPSSRVGALAMEQLRGIDQIAYIRFASVYQSFEDLEDLKREVDTPVRREGQRGATPSERPVRSRHPRRARGGDRQIEPYDPQDLQPSSVDLHLDRSFRVFRNNRYPYIDVRAPQPDLTELLTSRTTSRSSSIPGEFVLGQTLEWVELPDDLVARLEGKSSLGPSRAADPLDGGLRRPGLEGQPDARAVERRQPADRALPRHADRPDLVLQDVVRRSIGRTARRSSARATRARRSRRRRPSTGTSTAKRLSRVAHQRRGRLAARISAAAPASRSSRPGTFRSDAGALFGPVPRLLWDRLVTDEIDARAPPAPGAQLPADRDAVGARAGRDRASASGSTTRPATMRVLRGPGRSCRRSRRPGSCPRPSTSWR